MRFTPVSGSGFGGRGGGDGDRAVGGVNTTGVLAFELSLELWYASFES